MWWISFAGRNMFWPAVVQRVGPLGCRGGIPVWRGRIYGSVTGGVAVVAAFLLGHVGGEEGGGRNPGGGGGASAAVYVVEVCFGLLVAVDLDRGTSSETLGESFALWCRWRRCMWVPRPFWGHRCGPPLRVRASGENPRSSFDRGNGSVWRRHPLGGVAMELMHPSVTSLRHRRASSNPLSRCPLGSSRRCSWQLLIFYT